MSSINTQLPKILIAIALFISTAGVYAGITSDFWGWWYIPVSILAGALWLVRNDPKSKSKKMADGLLKIIALMLFMAAILALAFIIWFKDFEF